jgi:hypothetical protein
MTVECRSDSVYPERPVAVTWNDMRHEVETILSRWRTPDGIFFRVRATDGLAFQLIYRFATDTWDVEPI